MDKKKEQAIQWLHSLNWLLIMQYENAIADLKNTF
jgi:hypothetical protein